MLHELDADHRERAQGAIGELKYTAENALPQLGDRVLPQQLLGRRELPRPRRRRGAARSWAPTASCGAATTRTTRAPRPSPVSTCARCSTPAASGELRDILGGNAAKLYDFDLDALAPLAEQYGPTVDEIAQPLDALPGSQRGAPTRRRLPAGVLIRYGMSLGGVSDLRLTSTRSPCTRTSASTRRGALSSSASTR